MDNLDNDMDDLFRKAGEQYPLKISEPDWDGVTGRLQEENSGDHNAEPRLTAQGARNKRKWLLILIPLSLASLVYISRIIKHQSGGTSAIVVKSNPGPEINKTKTNPATTIEQVRRGNGTHTADNTAAFPNDQFNKSIRQQSDYIVSGNSQSKKDLHSINRNSKIYMDGGNRQSENDIYSKNRNLQSDANDISKANNPIAGASPLDQETFQMQLAKSLSLTAVSGSVQIISVNEIPLFSSSLELAPMKGRESTHFVQSSKRFYVGFLAGPDFSAVKFQSVKQVGFSLGVLVGYHFNQRLAIETGLMLDKKYYYSKGEYFNKNQAGIPYDILSLDGNCFMFEIPINLRYDFASGKNHGFFVKAGFSSYLMKKESYSYIAERYGNLWPSEATYNNGSINIFSILQLSTGYEFAISRNTKISIEPYVKIPFQGIGIGGMPISSAGLYLGISRSFR